MDDNHIVWTPKALADRIEDALVVAKKFFGDQPDYRLWENRTVNYAAGLPSKTWNLLKRFPKQAIVDRIEALMRIGVPFDSSFQDLYQLDAQFAAQKHHDLPGACCPYCGVSQGCVANMNLADASPPSDGKSLAVCCSCTEISVFCEKGTKLRKPTDEELFEIVEQNGPHLAKVRKMIRDANEAVN